MFALSILVIARARAPPSTAFARHKKGAESYGPAPNGAQQRPAEARQIRVFPAPATSACLANVVERGLAGVARTALKLVLDADELVVLGDTVAAARCARLDLAGVDAHDQVGDRGVLGLAGTVAHDASVAGLLGGLDGLE